MVKKSFRTWIGFNMDLAAQVARLYRARQPFHIVGGGTKSFLGNPADPDLPRVSTTNHEGILAYEPAELILRARAGTSLVKINEVLAAEGQMLGFEPPDFDGKATLGGAIAAGLSGARRPWYGAARDFVLGVGLITGEGMYLEFGGQVMKNVAGFDVSRLVTGALGTLGVIADVSLKVLPAPELVVSLCVQCNRQDAHRMMLDLSNRSIPISGACHSDQALWVRLSGANEAVEAARTHGILAGAQVADTPIWKTTSNFTLPGKTLWRLSVPPSSPALLDECSVIDWGGAQRFLADPDFNPRHRLDEGHATLIRTPQAEASPEPFAELSPAVWKITRRLKQAFDP
ncbi:MAG: glycolate oxidase subunit GlcE, partial [Pseudomonadales bacterium]